MSCAAPTLRRGHLDYRPQLFRKTSGDDVRLGPEFNPQAAMTGKGHLQHAEQHAAVRAIMVGKQQPLILQLAQGRKKSAQQFRTVQIRGHATALHLHLRPA